MIVPSIDLMEGQAVQLVGGAERAVDAGDPRPIADRFGRVGEVAVIDLDAALGRGDNADLVRELLGRARCRVGGGIRDVETAIRRLDEGAESVILGTAATLENVRRLPRERVIAALDARHGEVVVEGWTKGTGTGIAARMRELRDHVGGFLVTLVEHEGRMTGVDLEAAHALRREAGEARLTLAGGITTPEDIAELDRLGIDAQVGMALYTGRLDLADALTAPLRSERPDGLWPTIVADEQGVALGLAWSGRESVRDAVESGRGVFQSRTRGRWIKGATSGAGQDLLRVDLDCDRDCLRFTVRQHGPGFCHEGTRTCFGDDPGLGRLARLVRDRLRDAPTDSYTRRLLDEPDLLRAKLVEEARELAAAGSADEAAHETADVLYFALVALARAGGTLGEVQSHLDRRTKRVTRRPGDAKPGSSSAAGSEGSS